MRTYRDRIYQRAPADPVTIVVEHPSCDGCAHAQGEDRSHCVGCTGWMGPKEHSHWTAYRKGTP